MSNSTVAAQIQNPHHLPRHEQGESFAAADRILAARPEAGVALGTSGPRARPTSLTAIAEALHGFLPVIANHGRCEQNMIGRGAFQETDIIGVTFADRETQLSGPRDVNDIPRICERGVCTSPQAGRPARW